MKRSLVLSVCAAALAACFTHNAQADVDLQLLLTYTDPADESAGGSWELLTQSDAAQGVAGLRVFLSGVDAAVTANASVFDNTDSIFETRSLGSAIEIVAGDDLAGTLVTGVGTVGGPGDQGPDSLLGGNTIWDNSALIASGTFSATRPSFLEVNGTNGNLEPGTGIFGQANEFVASQRVEATIGSTSVRGDSVATDGLLPGDANRDGSVNLNDFSLLSSNFGNNPTNWGEGNFNSLDGTNLNDFSLLSANFGGSSSSPSISAVPEPGSLAMLTIGAFSLLATRRKR